MAETIIVIIIMILAMMGLVALVGDGKDKFK